MTTGLWSDVDRILGDALGREGAERAAFVSRACAGHPDLAGEVHSLLAAHERGGPLDALDALGGSDELEPKLAGRRVGPYRLVREIGRGGMGSVWLAERSDDQFQKQVAIKILSAGLPMSEALRRFRDERRILASLEHPHIARLLDAGRTDDGLHYIIMEVVEGVPITEHCRAHGLDGPARVALLRTVASAVHFAHQRLVVHRDLKPANILVAADGQPRLLDFGLAKVLAPDSAAETVPLLHLATPAYASPEQLRGLPATTSSDVYALGTVAYEVLAGALPDRSRPAPLEGDLDAIVTKATRPEPQDRYASAEELAADFGRYLERRPVLARGGAIPYRLQRFVARHRAGVAAAAVALFAAGAGIAGVLWQASIARQERRVAEARFNDVRQLAGAMLFELYDGIAPLPGSTEPRRALVTKGLQYFDGLARDAGHDPALSTELASAYLRVADVQFHPRSANLGDTAGALASLARARRILDGLLAGDPGNRAAQRLLARAHLATGSAHLYLRSWQPARASVESGLKIREALATNGDDTDRRDLALAYHQLADVVTVEDRAASMVPRQRALRMLESLLVARPDDDATLQALALVSKVLGSTLNDLKRYDEAEPYYARALAIDEKRVAASPNSALARLDLSFDLSLLATLRMNHDDYRGALVYWGRTIDVRKSLVEADPHDARAKGRLAYAYLRASGARFELGDYRASLDAATTALALADALLAANPADAMSRTYGAQAWRRIGDNERALAGRAAAPDRAAHATRACAAYGRSRDAYTQVIAAGKSLDSDREDAEELRRLMAFCQPGIAVRTGTSHRPGR